MHAIAYSTLFVVSAAALLASGQEGTDSGAAPTDARTRLATICSEMNEALTEFYRANEAIEEIPARDAHYRDHNPLREYVRQLIDLERDERGTRVGLLAARQLVLLGAGGGYHDGPRYTGRHQAIQVLSAYADDEVLPEVLRYLTSAMPDVATAPCLREIAAKTSLEQNRLFAKYMLARWILSVRDARTYYQQRLRELDNGTRAIHAMERKHLQACLAGCFPESRVEALEQEALSVLSVVAHSESGLRQPGIEYSAQNDEWIAIDKSKSASMPLISTLAQGLLFKEKHLRVGKTAPELELELVDGSSWSMTGNRGKVIVIQFSFKGCGPCEAMYEGLRSLKEEFAGQLSILSIMADKDRADTVEAVETGKITWNVAWDGARGPIATRWSVQSFPTVFVIAPDGTIAAVDLRGGDLRTAVEKRIAEN